MSGDRDTLSDWWGRSRRKLAWPSILRRMNPLFGVHGPQGAFKLWRSKLSMNRPSERGQPCPREATPSNSRTWLSALLFADGSWPRFTSRFWTCSLLLPLFLGACFLAAAEDAAPAADLDRVEWFDGSKLRGRLTGIDGGGHLTMTHAEARDPLKFRTRNLASIELGNRSTTSQPIQSTARLSFVNGDEIPGRLIGLDEGNLEFETWQGQKVKAPRSSVRSIAFFHNGLVVLYEGPSGMEGWKLGPGQRAWSYRDRAFTANGAGMIGRAVKLPKRSSIAFDLEWSNNLALMVGFYTDSVDRLDYNANSYLLYVTSGVVALQRIQKGLGANHLGQVEIPSMLEQNRVSLEVRTDQAQGNVMLFANGLLVQRWQDQGGFAAEGTGITFYAQLNESSLKLSHLRVTEWDGNFESDPASGPPQSGDVAKLANRDRLVGSLESVVDGKATFKTASVSLTVPLKRVTQILLHSLPGAPLVGMAGMVGFQFDSGARLSMSVDSWTNQIIQARSPQFGTFKFDLASVRKMQFNLDRVRVENSPTDSEPDPLLQDE